MRRRDLLAGLMAITTSSALRAREPNKVYRLAACTQFGMDWFSPGGPRQPFQDRLRELGYTEGKNLIVDRYAADLRPERYAEIAREVARAKPDVITIGFDHQLISQVAKEAPAIPIVALMGDPVAAGLVRNLARPEGNITGIALDAGIEMQGKHLDILRQAVPSARRIAYLSNRVEWEGAWGRAVIDASHQSGISIIGIPMETSADEVGYRQAFETMARQSADALIFNGFAANFKHRYFIAELAAKFRLPSICWQSDVVEKGQGFLSYAPDYREVPDRWADQVSTILQGAKPSEIPIYQLTKFILAINLKTAKVLGLNIPSTLLASADEVIE